MVTYPVHVPRDHYYGKDERRRRKAQRYNQIAQECEDYLNRKIRDDPAPVQQYEYWRIAHDLNLILEEVQKVMIGVECGHNGITIQKTATSATP
jgi:hypothetical protein